MIKKAFTMSYDDGVTQDRRFLDLINKYNLKCTFNLCSGKNPHNSLWIYDESIQVTSMELKDCVDIYAGHEIALHGRMHLHPNELKEEDFEDEYLIDKVELEKIFDTKIHGMVYAFGESNENIKKYLDRIGIKYARRGGDKNNFNIDNDLLEYAPTCHHSSENLFSLGENFVQLKADSPQIFYLWGHSYEFDKDKEWERIEEFFKLISNREDIFYGTNNDVFRYYGLI